MIVIRRFSLLGIFLWAVSDALPDSAHAQVFAPPLNPVNPVLPSPKPLPPQLEPLPPPEDLLKLPKTAPLPELDTIPGTIAVAEFRVLGSTVFSAEQLAAATKPFTGEKVNFTSLLQARTAITELYLKSGYITTGAYLPEQTIKDGIVTLQVVEGYLDRIRISGTKRLDPKYIRQRIARGAKTPLNQQSLLKALQLMRLDPLIKSLSAELAAGTKPGQNILLVKVEEAPTLKLDLTLNNSASPTVGTFARTLGLEEANLFGQGDDLKIGYRNTRGSNQVDVGYTIPFNAQNGTVGLNYGYSTSVVIERPFDFLDIRGNSHSYGITVRQPLWRSPSQEFALGLTFGRRNIQTSLLGVPFPLSAAADSQGQTQLSVLRFFQDWSQRSRNSALVARSETNFGLGIFNDTINPLPPDSQFFYWRGQVQWIRQLARDRYIRARSSLQIADRPIPAVEQFSLGGESTIRGYRQDALLADNGFLASVELLWPLYRTPKRYGILHISPFIDVGTVWNNSVNQQSFPLTANTLASTGIGVQWQWKNRFNVKFDWAVPLLPIETPLGNRTLQENGFHLSIKTNLF